MDTNEIVESLLTEDTVDTVLPELLAFIKAKKLANNRAMGLTYPGVDSFEVGTDNGPKWVRIWIRDGSSRSCFGFVDKETGHLWKSAGWKAPERNFPRGSLFDKGTWGCVGPYSIGSIG